MGLATERLYDPKKPLYFAKNTRFDGRDYKKGDEAPTKDMSQRTILKYFRTRLFVHKVRGKEPEKVVEETPKEVPTQDEDVTDIARVVEDSDNSFRVEYRGRVREISRNQLRSDGTLTKGGLKLFEVKGVCE